MTDRTFTAAELREVLDGKGTAPDKVQALRELILFPPRPTLADMTEEERAACQWMQCDVKGDAPSVILRAGGLCVHLVDKAGIPFKANHGDVTPRPDLPRLEWPSLQGADQ